MSISKNLRYEILRRDGYRCRYCGIAATEPGPGGGVGLTIDHVVPRALGGDDEAANLVAACWDCNRGKSSTPPDAELVEDVEHDALRWAEAMRVAAKLDARKRSGAKKAIRAFDEEWEKAPYGPPQRPVGWAESIKTFYEAGLTPDDIASLASKVIWGNKVSKYHQWKYFCGACWNTIRDRQETARQLLAAAGDDADSFRVAEGI